MQEIPISFKRQLEVARLETAFNDDEFVYALRAADCSVDPAEDPLEMSDPDSTSQLASRVRVGPIIPVLRSGEYVERAEIADDVVTRLLEKTDGIMPVVALHGMPGVGKTTLAQAVAHDPRVAKRFAAGILWELWEPHPIYPER